MRATLGNFNLAAWDKGGRLYSIRHGSYQRMPAEKRLQMTINSEAVADVDIRASFLTCRAKFREPLEGSSDPYVRAGVERDVAKLWMWANAAVR
jgi:hypothetical protein